MSHEIDMSNGRANMAYRGEKPWHGLGFTIEEGDDVNVIRAKAGLGFDILKADVLYRDIEGVMHDGNGINRSVLYRSDTRKPLSIMSTKNYQIAQPDQILGFIDESARAMGWSIETAGSLHGGKKIWALAKMNEETNLGTEAAPDVVKGYLLAATSCDGSMASEFMFTSVRVVCNNTLHAAVDDETNGKGRVKVYHFAALDTAAVKKQLGIAGSVWASFIEQAKKLASVRVNNRQAVRILRAVYEKPEERAVEGVVVTDEMWLKEQRPAAKVLELFEGQGLGSMLATARGTAWGLVNATTEYYDHVSGSRSTDHRLNSAWFGTGAQRKQAVVDECLYGDWKAAA